MSEAVNTELIHEEGRSLISVILLFIKLELLTNLVASPFIIISFVLDDYKLYEACMFVEIIGLILSYFYVVSKHCKKEKFKIRVKQKFPIRFLVYMLLIQISYTLLYETTLGAFLNRFEVSKNLIESGELWNSAVIFGSISVCIIGPIVEELLYRGVLLEHMRKRYNPLVAVLVSSLFFGIVHGNLHQGVGSFFFGLCLGIVYVKTNSILASIFLHMVNNSLYTFTNYPFVDIHAMAPVVIIISLALLVISLLLISKTKIDESKKFNFRFLEKHNLAQ
ncbi:CPBP family intramembrane glutamic endopeptidase [Oceanirhabdus seepicola]|uniref:CPBP family intramembrane metalloprotease n=1 Tax=Oceanirhabdus seepicola TaxID=2828781 RepID=A0A9J6NXV8_9CLOT|nr:type II CAAX endopeptidase family protein [Oceanirhabdus seepicola]MCM1989351.1 CPBP family intramembrane metalloprotease [Oceanirhabdus seepicola]